MDRVSYGERGRREYTRDFFRIQILCSITRDMFGEAVRLEALLNGLEDDLFEGAGRVLAELSEWEWWLYGIVSGDGGEHGERLSGKRRSGSRYGRSGGTQTANSRTSTGQGNDKSKGKSLSS